MSSLELFFDLVFVFTVTQLTAVLTDEPNGTGLARVALMLGLIWWMYGGYAWLTNAVVLDGATRRLLLLLGMGAYLVLALTIPRAFAQDGDGVAFGLAYLAIVLIHAGLFTRASGRGAAGILRIAPYNLVSALLVLVGGVVGGNAQYAIWILAFLLEWCTPFLVPPQAFFEIEPAHFVERHGLVVIVAIGESVVAIGIGAAGFRSTLPWPASPGSASHSAPACGGRTSAATMRAPRPRWPRPLTTGRCSRCAPSACGTCRCSSAWSGSPSV